MLYSAITYLLEIIVPLNAPLTNQPLLELVYAMLLTSIGAAMIFNNDASSGGTDIALNGINIIGNSLYFIETRNAESSWLHKNSPRYTNVGSMSFYK